MKKPLFLSDCPHGLAATMIFLLILIASASFNVNALDRIDGPVDFIESPASRAASGLYSFDADNYIRPAYYKDIEMIKEIIFLSFNDIEFGTFGYGRYFGNLYAAIYYGGNMFQGYFNNIYSEKETALPGGDKKTFKAYNSVPEISSSGNNNRFALLIAAGKIGIRISYASTFDNFNGSDITFDREGTSFFYKKL